MRLDNLRLLFYYDRSFDAKTPEECWRLCFKERRCKSISFDVLNSFCYFTENRDPVTAFDSNYVSIVEKSKEGNLFN